MVYCLSFLPAFVCDYLQFQVGSFVTGAVTSVVLLWSWQALQQLFALPDLLDSTSWVDPWSIRNSKDVGTRGRTHWPWETIRRKVLGSPPPPVSEPELEHPAPEIVQPLVPKERCIGNIFGLDVGGTLAKLVYFEEKPPDFDPVNARDRQYIHAASAQEVLKSRSQSNLFLPNQMKRRRRSFSARRDRLTDGLRRLRRRRRCDH